MAVNKPPFSTRTTMTTTTKSRWLLVHRGNEPNRGLWSMPGGKIKLGEGTLDAAIHKLWEETGLLASKSLSSIKYNLKWYKDGPLM